MSFWKTLSMIAFCSTMDYIYLLKLNMKVESINKDKG